MRESKNSKMADEYCEKLKSYLFLEGVYKQRKFLISINESDFFKLIYTDYRLLEALIVHIGGQKITMGEIAYNIKLAQLHFAVIKYNELRLLYANNKELYRTSYLIKYVIDNKFYPIFNFLDTVSKKYGLFISDLCASYIKIDLSHILRDFSSPHICWPYPTKETMFRYMDASDFSSLKPLKQERLLNALDTILGFAEEERIAKTNFAELLKGSPYNLEFKSSFHTRIIGIWLWDNVNDPTNENKIGFKEAISILEKEIKPKSQDIEVFIRYWRDELNHTSKCIEEGKFIPYGNKDHPESISLT